MEFGLFKKYNAEAAAAAKEAREKAMKYAELVNTLETHISLIDNNITDAESSLKTQHETFQSNPDSAEGDILTTFNNKESDVWKTQYETVISNMKRGLSEAKMRKSSATQLKIYWEQRAEIEEAKIYAGF